MENGKHFIVVKELKSSTSDTGNIVTEEFNLLDIKKTLGDKVNIVDTKIQFDNNNSKVYLILTCKNIVQTDKKPLTEPLIKVYPNPDYKEE